MILRNDCLQVEIRALGAELHSIRTPDGTESRLSVSGVWHSVKTDAPFICLEPWAALPGRDGITEDLETCPNVINLAPGETYRNCLMLHLR